MKPKFTTILKIAKILVFLNFLLLNFLPLFASAQTIPATPQTSEDRCKAFKAQFSLTSGVNISNGVPVYCSATTVILNEITAGLMISGVVSILFLMYGGFIYLTSAGNEEAAEKGRKILINTIIGLTVIIMSTAIVTIVAALLSGR